MPEVSLMPEQCEFLTSTSPIVGYVGGIGAGKSFVSCIKAARNASMGRAQLMIGLTFSQAKDVLLTTMEKVLGLFKFIEGYHYKINRSELNITFMTGGIIYIRSAEIGDRLRGYTVSDAYIDEAAYLKNRVVFDILLGRLRESHDGQIHLTTSPNGFNWVYDIVQSEECQFLKVSTFKNPFLPEQYIKNMIKQYSSKFIQQELYADFVLNP